MIKEYSYKINFGAETKMYTLWFKGGHYPSYIKNLSTKPDLAIQKAKEYLADFEGWDEAVIQEELDISTTEYTLEEIRRRTQEQILQDSIAKKEANIAKWVERSLQQIEDGINPFDKQPIPHTYPPQYNYGSLDNMELKDINYWANLTEFKSEVHQAMHDYCKPNSIELIQNANIHFGNVGDKKVRVRVQFVSLEHKDNPHAYGTISTFRFHTKDGARIIFSTSSYDAADKIDWQLFTEESEPRKLCEGNWITIEGTIKEHINFEPKEYVTMETSGKQVEMPTGKVYKSTKMIRVKPIGENNDT